MKTAQQKEWDAKIPRFLSGLSQTPALPSTPLCFIFAISCVSVSSIVCFCMRVCVCDDATMTKTLYFLLYLPFFGRLLSILRSLFLPFSAVFQSSRLFFSSFYSSLVDFLLWFLSICIIFSAFVFSRVSSGLCRAFLHSPYRYCSALRAKFDLVFPLHSERSIGVIARWKNSWMLEFIRKPFSNL